MRRLACILTIICVNLSAKIYFGPNQNLKPDFRTIIERNNVMFIEQKSTLRMSRQIDSQKIVTIHQLVCQL